MGQGTTTLGLTGPVGRRPLDNLLRGCHPAEGCFLPARKPARRRAGWDLTLAAPKSVSLLAALAVDDAEAIATAHRAAVDDVVWHFERRHLALRRAHAGNGLVRVDGLIAAAFDHGVNAAGDPHLHTHLLVCNLGQDRGGVWSAIHSGWWTGRASLGAIYQMSLRHHLRQSGLNLPWRVRDDGFAEIIGVPRQALRDASGRSRAAAAARAAFGERAAGRTVGIRSAATAQGRQGASPSGPASLGAIEASPSGPAGFGPIEASPSGPAGFGPVEAARLVAEARCPIPRQAAIGEPAGAWEAAVTARLAARRSWFRSSDVVVALAACAAEGLTAADAEQRVDRFCTTARPVTGAPGQAPRWTTDVARAADERLWACAQRLTAREPRSHDGRPLARAANSYPGLAFQARGAVHALVAGGRSMHILQAPAGYTNLLAQAAVLEAAGAAWSAQGRRVVIETWSDQASLRWRVLAGLDRYRSGRIADVVVIDHADRRPSAELLGFLRSIDRSGAQAVLIEGGTAPRLSWRCSAALAELGDWAGRLDPGPPPAWGANLELPVREGASASATEAVHALLSAWVEARVEREPPLLVGLGFAEVDGLNQAARTMLTRRGQLDGPVLVNGGRPFQAGDQALALRRLAPTLPPGSLLSVVEVDPQRGVAAVTGPDRRTHILERAAMAHVGHGYAVTPALAARAVEPLLVLGPADAMGPERGRVLAATLGRGEVGRNRDQAIGLGLA